MLTRILSDVTFVLTAVWFWLALDLYVKEEAIIYGVLTIVAAVLMMYVLFVGADEDGLWREEEDSE